MPEMGLKINTQKTYILSKNMTETQALDIQHKSGFSLSSKVKYIGIYLIKYCSSLIQDI